MDVEVAEVPVEVPFYEVGSKGLNCQYCKGDVRPLDVCILLQRSASRFFWTREGHLSSPPLVEYGRSLIHLLTRLGLHMIENCYKLIC